MAHLHGAPLCWQLTPQGALVSWVMSPPCHPQDLMPPSVLPCPSLCLLRPWFRGSAQHIPSHREPEQWQSQLCLLPQHSP